MPRETSSANISLRRIGRRVLLAYGDLEGEFERILGLRAYQQAMQSFSRTGQAEIPTERGRLTLARKGRRISLGVDEGYNGMNLIIYDSGLSTQGLVDLAA